MKKVMFGLAAAAAIAAFGIESANTVGYQNYNFTAEGDYIHNIGVAFKNCTAVDGSYTITTKLFDTDLQDGDALLIFNPDAYNYDFYTYMADTDGQGTPGFYVMFGDLVSPDAYVYSLSVAKGDNVLFMPANANSATVSGEVERSGTATVTFTVEGSDYIFPITNPFPIDTKFSDLTMLQDGDALLIFNPEAYNYDFYTYMADTDGQGTPGFYIMWGDLVSPDSYVTDTNTVILSAGQGALYMPTDSRTWTVTYNY